MAAVSADEPIYVCFARTETSRGNVRKEDQRKKIPDLRIPEVPLVVMSESVDFCAKEHVQSGTVALRAFNGVQA